MSNLVGLLLQLAIIAAAMATLLCIVTPEDAVKKVAGLVVLLLLVECAAGVAQAIWADLPWWGRSLSVLTVILLVSIVIRKGSS